MKWITREKAHVDRIACPWLIRKFVDPDAEFVFAPPEKVLSMARETGATPFDVKGVELGHHGEFCSFDAIVRKFGLTDPALLELARIVRAADTESKEVVPEAAGLEAVASGFRLISKDDFENMHMQWPVYEALYAYCRNRLGK